MAKAKKKTTVRKILGKGILSHVGDSKRYHRYTSAEGHMPIVSVYMPRGTLSPAETIEFTLYENLLT